MSGCVGPALSVSVPSGLCVGARRSLWAPAVSASGPGALCRAPPALCVGASVSVSVSGPGALCVRLCWPGALCVPSGLCVGARRSLCRGRSLRRGPALCVGPRQSGPGALCVGAAISVSGPGALCVGACGGLCVGARRSLCRRSASGPDGLCVGARRSASGPGALRRSPALFVSRQHSQALRSLCVGPRRTRRAPEPDTRAPGPDHRVRERGDLTRRAPGPDIDNAGARHRNAPLFSPTVCVAPGPAAQIRVIIRMLSTRSAGLQFRSVCRHLVCAGPCSDLCHPIRSPARSIYPVRVPPAGGMARGRSRRESGT